MKWKLPKTIKVYEALGALADGRVEATGDTGKVYSSSRKKFYDVSYDPINQAIMSNDNASYWQGYLGYPAIAFLIKIGVVSYDKKIADLLAGIAWKELHQKMKNFDKEWAFILESKTEAEKKILKDFGEKVMKEIKSLNLSHLGERKLPPTGD
ncbi:MAG TPA: hypothetical protein VJG67_01290 [Candidatus Paceibacterota bacterium]